MVGSSQDNVRGRHLPPSAMEIPVRSGATYTRAEVLAILAVAKKVAGGVVTKYPKEELWKTVESKMTIKREKLAIAAPAVIGGIRRGNFLR